MMGAFKSGNGESTMATPPNNVAQTLETASAREKDLNTLGKISLTVCMIGMISMIVLNGYHPGHLSHYLRFSFTLLPFVGCQVIAFVTGVFAWKSIFGKCGAIASMIVFLLFLMSAA